jgi:hypothetical protein
VGLYYVDGGCDYEWQISVERMGNGEHFRVIIWDDAMAAFKNDAELLMSLGGLRDSHDMHGSILHLLGLLGYANIDSMRGTTTEKRYCRACKQQIGS